MHCCLRNTHPTPVVSSAATASEEDSDVTVMGMSVVASSNDKTSTSSVAVTTAAVAHSSSVPQTCPVCCEQLPPNQTLNTHLSTGPERECALCLMRVVGSSCAFKAHLAFHLGVPRVCPECGWTLPDSWSVHRINEAMRRHQRTNCFHFQRVRVYLCQRCQATPRAFSSHKQLVEHIISVHVERFCRCPVCRVAFPSKFSDQLGAHMRMVHNSSSSDSMANRHTIFKCPLCNDVYEEVEGLTSHIHGHLANNLRCQVYAFKCLDRCKQIFMDQWSLAKHRRICKVQRTATPEPKGLPCLLCDKAAPPRYFQRARDVLHHERSHLHVPSGETGVMCPWCAQRLTTKDVDVLLDHLRRHVNAEDNSNNVSATSTNAATENVLSVDESDGDNDAVDNSSSSPPVPVSATPLQCHCGQQITTFSELQEHCASEQGRQHPVVPESRYTQANDDLFRCSACEQVLEAPPLTEHIFAQHTSLCYCCNHARLTMRHLWDCLQRNEPIVGAIVRDVASTAAVDNVSATTVAPTPPIEAIKVVSNQAQSSVVPPTDEFICDICTTFSCCSELELREHFKTIHGVARRHACAVCGACFDSLVELRTHTLEIHFVMDAFNEPYTCWLCSKERSFSTRSSLETHIIRAHRVAKSDINWSQMPRLGLCLSRVKRAASTETEGSLQGDDACCNSPPPPPSAGADGGYTSSAKRLRLAEPHPSDSEMYSCAHCDYSCAERPTFLRHIVRHKVTTNFRGIDGLQCPECGLLFASCLSIKLHLTAAHRVSDSVVYLKRHHEDMTLFSQAGSGDTEASPSAAAAACL